MFLRLRSLSNISGIHLVLGSLAVFYIGVSALFAPTDVVGDEERYLAYAKNLANGFYVSPEYPDFTNGPGYPLVIMPFVALEFPLWVIRGLNIGFLLAAGYLFFKTLRLFTSEKWSLVFLLFLALNPVMLRYLAHAKTEALSTLLVCGFIWAFANLLNDQSRSRKWMIRTACFLFGLIMVRVIFGYVAMAAVVLVPLLCWLVGNRARILTATLPFAFSLVLCLPWLAYTYHHTHKFPTWSTNGGELLYWITSPYPGEWGSWFSIDSLPENPQAFENHIAACVTVEALPFAERDAKWVEFAKANFHATPSATVRNLAANFCRILFGFPNSHRGERLATIFWVIPSALVLGMMLFAVYPTIRVWKTLPLSIKVPALCAAIFFGGSVLLPAEPRYLLPIVPIVLLWLAYIYGNVVSFEIKTVSTADEWGSRAPSA